MPPPPTGYAGAPPGQLAPVVPPRWRSLQGLTTALTLLFSLAAADAVFGVIAYANRVKFIKDVLDGNVGFNAGQRADNADNLVGAAAGIMALLSIAIFVLIIIWLWRAAKNNEALGRMNPRLGPGWAIGGWFIPFANLVIPILILQDLWRGANPEVARGDPGWRATRGSGLIGWYWATFVLSLLRAGFGRSSAHINVRSEMRGLRAHDVVAAIGMAFAVAAAVLAVFVVRRLAERQEDCLRAQQAAWHAANPGL
jgi:hypothetical protein